MKDEKILLEIQNDTFEMGKKEHKKYLKTNAHTALEGCNKSYRTAMQAMRYKILYNSITDKSGKKIK